MEEPKKEDMCPGKMNKTVGDCYYNHRGVDEHQIKEGEKLCSHCFIIN